jgi:hypothetical protein
MVPNDREGVKDEAHIAGQYSIGKTIETQFHEGG